VTGRGAGQAGLGLAALIDDLALARAPASATTAPRPSLAPSMSMWKGRDQGVHPGFGLRGRF
jgi:hypothetical protein